MPDAVNETTLAEEFPVSSCANMGKELGKLFLQRAQLILTTFTDKLARLSLHLPYHQPVFDAVITLKAAYRRTTHASNPFI